MKRRDANAPIPRSSRGDEALKSHGWHQAPLEEICEIQLGKMLSPKSRGGVRPLPYLRNANVQWDRFDLADVSQMDFDEREEKKFQLRPGDLLVCEGGEPGRAAVWNGEITRCCYQKALHRIRPIGDSVDPHFLKYRLWLAASMGEFLDSNAKTTIAHLPAIRLAKLRVALPGIAEQRRMAGRLREQLAAVAQARAAVQAQLDAAQALPAAHLRIAFNGDAAKKWPSKPLIEASEISGGITLGRNLRGRATRVVPYLRVANVKDGHLDLSHVKEVEATESEIEDCRLIFGDILLTEGGDPDKLGRGTYWQEQIPECIHQNHIFRVRFDLAAFNPAFVAFQMGSPYGKAYFLAHAKQTTGIASINKTVLSKFPLLVPPFAEQCAIASQLEAERKEAASLTNTLDEKLAALDHLPAALLREAFSGKAG